MPKSTIIITFKSESIRKQDVELYVAKFLDANDMLSPQTPNPGDQFNLPSTVQIIQNSKTLTAVFKGPDIANPIIPLPPPPPQPNPKPIVPDSLMIQFEQ